MVLVVLSFGTPIAIVHLLRVRKDRLNEPKIKELFGALYSVYRPGAYYFEAVNLLFKLALWATLVFFDHGSEMQLACALVVNILQLCIHVYVLPFGTDDAALLNG